MLARRSGLLALLASVGAVAPLASCASTPTGTLELVTGEEADVLTRAPAPTLLVVESVDTENVGRELARAPLPAGDISLGDVAPSDVGSIRVTGLDAAGKVLVRGETLLFQYGALEEATLEVFVQRAGELARVPRPPALSLDAPLLDTVVGRYVVAASGTRTVLYDLLTMRALRSPELPRQARSLATYGSSLLVVDEQGATSLSLSDASTYEQPAPLGASWAEIAGGATVNAPDGSTYVVGGTRITGGASQRVLKISAEGVLSAATLQVAREGACATWVAGRGLVVVGGSATGAGVELLAPGTNQATPLAYPPDGSSGCGVAAVGPGRVVVAGGGLGAARVIDLACTSGCAPAPWPGDVPVVRAQVVALAVDAALVVGDDAAGATRVFRASAAGAREIPLRVPRRSARLVPLPNGASAVVGGAPQIETYRD